MDAAPRVSYLAAMPPPILTIAAATTRADYVAASTILRAHGRWLERVLGVAIVDRQPFWQSEIERPERYYALPDGQLVVARLDGDPVGVVGVRRDADATAELKRLFVVPAARGAGLGHALVQAAVQAARTLGARRLWLETSTTVMPAAVGIYRRHGFRETGPRDYADLPRTIGMQLAL